MRTFKPHFLFLIVTVLFALYGLPCLASERAAPDLNSVHLTLDQYMDLVKSASDPKVKPRPAPVGYAIGQADVTVSVSERDKKASADVFVTLHIQILEDEWVLVPILPAGTPINSAKVAGKTVELINTGTGLTWGAKKSGSYKMELKYSVDASRSGKGHVLALPIPQAAATSFHGTLPGAGLDATIIPSSGTTIQSHSGNTSIDATIPTSSGIQISWRTPGEKKQIISRAEYSGILEKDAVRWNAKFALELFHDETFTMKLLPTSVTLEDIQVDGKDAPILSENGSFSTLVKGQGKHTVLVSFQVPVTRGEGPPSVAFPVASVPVSKVALTLPGKKEVSVSPLAQVKHEEKEENKEPVTIASMNLPMTNQVSLSWSEALPEDLRAELRANASLYHSVFAEEGVLFVNAIADYEITRGETNILELNVPKGVQVNRISSTSGGISDWRVVAQADKSTDLLHIFLDRKIREGIRLQLFYDRSLRSEVSDDQFSIPLLRAANVHRQRGMVALLASKELTLNPVKEEEVSRVGENQLPVFVKENIDKTIAHTFKYVEHSPQLLVRAETPEKIQGKFDAVVNTLVSLSDVTLKGSASVDLSVKSGAIEELQLELPKDVNFLNLTAPSLRTHKLFTENDSNVIHVEFTQEMDGQLRIEVNYERIMTEGKSETKVPTLKVKGAEVEQGRIAVEALSAVEVQAASADQLSSLDPNELPKQLILKTTNPILLAYKYVYVDPPYELKLKITRHKEIDVQTATIDDASYRTLYTPDGIAVTTAQFLVRNSRQQFLRIQLPEGSKVWSAFVNGQPEKPAESEAPDGSGARETLIKIINSTTGFPVTLIYQTPVAEIGHMGTLSGILPRPKRMVVTQSRWDVYLPADLSFGRSDTNMNILDEGVFLTNRKLKEEVFKSADPRFSMSPLHIHVPVSGIRYSFQKLYANQATDDSYFSISYVSSSGRVVAQFLSLLGTVLIWLGIFALMFEELPISRGQAGGSATLGLALLFGSIGYLAVTPIPATVLSAIIAVTLIGNHVREKKAASQQSVSP